MNLTIDIFQTDFSTESTLAVDINGIVVNGVILNPGGSSSSETVVVDDGCPAVIQITQAGFYTYEMTINNVYSNDKTINIVLVPQITDINDANYLRPWPTFYTFYDSCSFCVDYYMASSYGGNISWYVNNELYGDGVSGKACFCNPGDFQLKVRNTTSQSVVEVPGCPPVVTQLWDNQFGTILTGNTIKADIDDLATYLALDTDTNLNIVEYRVDIAYELQTAVEPQKSGDVCCYSRGEDVTVVPTITLNRPGANPAFHTIKYTVVDPEGLTIDLPQDEFPVDIPNNTITFTLEKLGVYNVKIEVTDLDCGLTYEEEFIVETCNFVFLEYLACNTFDLQNRSSETPFTYSVSDIADSETVVQTGTLDPGTSINISFTSVSMFILDVTYERDSVTVEEQYVINNYCEIEKCFIDYIEDLLCAPIERCSPCPPENDLKQMFLFYNTYFMKVHKLFNTNSFYATLDEEGLAEITTLKQLMDKMLSFCQRRSCTDSVSSAFQSSYQTDGPYDWAGQGSNKAQSCNCGSKSTGGSYRPTSPGYCRTCNNK